MGMGSSGGGTMAEINVTPLVDVMLVLLIIFMVTAPMLNNAGVEIDLPRSEAPPLDLSSEEGQTILHIDAQMRVYIEDTEYTWQEMPDKLGAIAKANPNDPVFLRADGTVPYAEVARLLGMAKQAGMPRVGLVFEPGSPEGDTP